MSDALQLILANPEYRGLIPRNDTPSFEGLHERLVDHELFERAQQILRRRAATPRCGAAIRATSHASVAIVSP